MANLKPCPFCGGEADDDYYHAEIYNGPGAGRVTCVECGVYIEAGSAPWNADRVEKLAARAEAIVAWNTRAIAARETDNKGEMK